MSKTYADELRGEAAKAKPYDMRKARIADVLDHLARVSVRPERAE